MSMTATAPLRADSDRATTGTEARVIFASSLGTVFEWYDFYLYGSLASIIGAQFFSGFRKRRRTSSPCSPSPRVSWCAPSAPSSSAELGDLVGRKHTFLITI